MRVYNFFIKFIIVANSIFFSSCNSGSEKKYDDSSFKENKKSDNRNDKLFIEFNESLNSIKEVSLPYSYNEELFKYFYNNASENDIAKILKDSLKIKEYRKQENNIKYPDSIKVKPNSLKFNLYEYFYKRNYDKNIDFDFSICSSEILQSFDLSENRKLFMASSEVNKIKFLFVFIYENLKILDHHVVGILEGPADIYNKNAIYISKLGEIFFINHSWYENPSAASYGELKILPDGKFKVINEGEVDTGLGDSFHDYQNDYKKLEITPIAVDEKFQLFNQFKNDIPIITLPYNSKEFYNLMQIESPEKGKPLDTKLHHDQLSWNENVKYFFSKDPNTIAFKPKGKDYDQGYYFYPIGQIPIGGEHTGILYLYQSFCNYHPTVYIQLNTYDKQGNILDEQILDRRFYSGMYRFLSSIEIQEDLQINIKQFIQDYEGYDDTDQNSALKKPEIKETSFQITPEGLIK